MGRISTRLAVSFLIVALLPTLPLSLVVRNLLERRFGPALAQTLDSALAAGLTESQLHLRELRLDLQERSEVLAEEYPAVERMLLNGRGEPQPPDSLAVYLDQRPALQGALADLQPSLARIDDTLVLKREGHLFFQPLPAGMVRRVAELTNGMGLLQALRADEGRVVMSFVGPFLLVYGLLILLALVLGLLWSREMVRPLEMLVDATRRVSGGDLDFHLQKRGPGEVGELVRSFDGMVGRLAQQRRDLARLERAAAWRGMARTLAHEVKNPLTPILLAVNQARDAYDGGNETYRNLLDEVAEIVGEEVETLRRLVRDFGDFARLPKPVPEPGDPSELLRELAKLYGPRRLVCTGHEVLKPGWFDHDALRRALINLIDNALAACRESGVREQVHLSASELAGGLRLVIRDDGVGIAPENLEHIFEPDFTTKSGGMGLGLAVVENIVLGHGGQLQVRSKLGQGTSFTLDLPLTPGERNREEKDGAS